MSFLSFEFFCFVLVVFILYWNLPARLRPTLLIAASLVFYALSGNLLHLLAVVAVNWYFILLIAHKQAPVARKVLVLAVTANLLHLAFFKYINSLLAHPAVISLFGGNEPLWRIAQPLAISFYTFQVIGFLVDVSRGEVQQFSFRRFLLFMVFFPHMIAGPILRSRDFYKDIAHERETDENMTIGALLIAVGLFKKAVLADALAAETDDIWLKPREYTAKSLLLAAGAYSAQLYLDFSGLIDICRGVSRLFGYELPRNFKAPYLAHSFSDIWKHWHITLSLWIRDYLYIPLGGNRVSSARASFNLLAAMTLSGIWHGDTWNFFIWGLLHGLFLLLEKQVGLVPVVTSYSASILRIIYVFVLWSAAFVFFRAPDLPTAVQFFAGMGGGGGKELAVTQVLRLSVWAFLLQAAVLYLPSYRDYLLRWKWIMVPGVALVVMILLAMAEHASVQFIYHQF